MKLPAARSSSSSSSSQPPLKLKIDSDPANLAPVRRTVEEYCTQLGFEPQAIDEIGLCLNEAMANVIRHAYAGAHDRPIEVTVEDTGDGVRIVMRDWGNGIDPSKVERKEHDPLKPGGLGLICLSQWMDDVVFSPQPDGMLTTIIRRRKQGQSVRAANAS